MVLFRVVRDSPHPPAETWRRVTRWERHGGAVPLTRMVVMTPAPTREGTVFVARTGPAHSRLGRTRPVAAVLRWTGAARLGFDDPMKVTLWQPPADGAAGLCHLEKLGEVIRGRAEIEVRPSAAGALVVWREEARVRALPRFLDPLLAPACRLVFGRAMDRLLRD
ncbi:SRPBCC family protein [Streptomyces sp. TS71-3]|uniref:SRPBCC family protein n=1 Tax=Streptomyces sp. TS71-3 TaxID=2733862 RepID=UPI001BB4348C|nr:SRPBCC family protein [Streptomyces sp. TS71-3]